MSKTNRERANNILENHYGVSYVNEYLCDALDNFEKALDKAERRGRREERERLGYVKPKPFDSERVRELISKLERAVWCEGEMHKAYPDNTWVSDAENALLTALGLKEGE